jgi:hypothetical protein
MAGLDSSSMSEDGLLSVAEPIATDPATHSDELQEQLKSSARLHEYYNQVVAELRATLEQIEESDQVS